MPQRKLVKGSKEAKEFMAYLRSLRGKKKIKGGRDVALSSRARERIIAAINSRNLNKFQKLALYPYNASKAERYADLRLSRLPPYAQKYFNEHNTAWERQVQSARGLKEFMRAFKSNADTKPYYQAARRLAAMKARETRRQRKKKR